MSLSSCKVTCCLSNLQMTEIWPKVRLVVRNELGDVVCEKFAGIGAFQVRFGFGDMPGLNRYKTPLVVGDVRGVRAELDVLEFVGTLSPHNVLRSAIVALFADYFRGVEQMPLDALANPHRPFEVTS